MEQKLEEMTMNDLLKAIRVQSQVTAKAQEAIVEEFERRVRMLNIGKKQIVGRVAELNADERLGYPPADVFSNAPLALVQVQLETEVRALKWVLKVLESE
jgi:hypothetical protein